MEQTLFGGVQRWNRGQWAQIAGLSFSADIRDPSGRLPARPAIGQRSAERPHAGISQRSSRPARRLRAAPFAGDPRRSSGTAPNATACLRAGEAAAAGRATWRR